MASLPARRGGLLALLVSAAACTAPAVGDRLAPAAAPAGYRLAITAASRDATGHVLVTFSVTRDSVPVALADVPALRPSFTLAGLLTDPVSGLATWQSYLLVGSGRLANLPLGGPGTPAALILHDQPQPGAVTATAANLADAGGGLLVLTIGTPLPAGFDETRTMRIGAWLGAVPGTDDTSTTYDWVPAGGTPARRETVLDANCKVCHGRLTGHGGYRTGVRLCLTCHTTQNADPDTQDPAALVRALAVTPDQRTVLAGSAATSLTAALLSSTATISWSLSPPGAGSLSAAVAATTAAGGSTSTVRYTPPAPDPAASGPLEVTLTASVTVAAVAAGGYAPPPVTWSAPVALTVVQPPAALPALAVNPVAQTVLANGAAVPLSATLLGATGTVAWSVSPASGAGTLSASTGGAVSYTPPGAVSGPTTVTVTASGGGASGSCTLTVLPGAAGSATRLTDPNPLDLGRLVHRIHRGKNLPTLYLASSVAPAPALPAATALPLPFLAGRNAVAPGTEYSIWGYRGTELIAGRVVSRVSNAQPAKLMAQGIAFPRDLRDCDACHRGAPQQAEVVNAISRRTCQGCHPDVWFGAAPITDLVHFSHPGGPQADDTRCRSCHVDPSPGRGATYVPIAEAHLAPVQSPRFSRLTVALTGVSGLVPGGAPTFTFRVKDRVGDLTSLGSPSPATDTGLTPSPLPRALSRLAIVLSGPTGDYLTGNAPISLAPPLSSSADPVSGDFSYTMPTPLPAGLSGTWAVGLEARRQGSVAAYDPATDTFRWPYTGEPLTEYADNPVAYVDTALGSWPGGAPTPRRTVVDPAACRACHLDLSLHGGLRHEPEYCVLCHAADTTDWNRRPKGPDGNVDLATVYSDAKFGTYDDLEERSIHFKVLIHRIHTGEGQGTASLEVGAPHVVYGYGGTANFFDDVRFPNRLADCTLCHPGRAWLLEAIPADAAPTTANETATIAHAASASHTGADAVLRPMAAACLSCHGTAFASEHAAQYTSGGVEACAQCHAKGSLGVAAAHGLSAPAAAP